MELGHCVTQFVNRYSLTCDLSDRTRRAYQTDLAQFCAHTGNHTPLDAVGADEVEGWATELKSRGLEPATLKRKFAVLGVFFNYWVRRNALPSSPLRHTRLDLGRSRKLVRTLRANEMRALLLAADRAARTQHRQWRRELAIRNRALVEVMFGTGIRVGEAARLRMEDVVDHSTLRIRGKGARERLAVLTDVRTVTALNEHMILRRECATVAPAVFLGRRGDQLSEQGIGRVVAALGRSAGLERRITPHMLRHTVATLLLRNGANLRVVQEFLGHASVVTTERYTHVSKADLEATLEVCHPRRGLASP